MDEYDFPNGFGGIEKAVCVRHVADGALRERLSALADSRTCDYCGRRGGPEDSTFSVGMDALADAVWDALTWLYEEAGDPHWYDEDGDPVYYESYYELNDVLYDVAEEALDPDHSETLVEDLKSAVIWPDRYWLSRGRARDVTLHWESYSKAVRYQSRFVYIAASARPDHEVEPPAMIAKFLEALLGYAESELLIDLEPGSNLYRGRMTDDFATLLREVNEEPSSALGSAPAAVAKAGRLNPQGIGLFYAADNLATAVAEIALHSPYDKAVVGAFVTQRTMKILDFTRRMTVLPSLYASDEGSRVKWVLARFVDRFVEHIAEPVLLDGRESVDYVPTQVVAEYLRWVPQTRIDGIAWPSHLAKGSGKNVVLFLGPGAAFQTDPPTDRESQRAGGSAPPSLTLSRGDITCHEVVRRVEVSPDLEPDGGGI